MEKGIEKYIKNTYKSAIDKYKKATHHIGLWNSEEYVIDKYFNKNESILDLGCGTGRTTFALYKRGYTKITGLDLSEEMLDVARKIRDKMKLEIDFIQGNVLELPFSDNQFDNALFSFNGLMQIPKRTNRVKALKEIKRVLKPDGIFIFTTHDRNRGEEFKEFWQKEKKKWEKGIQDKRLFEYGDRITSTKNNNSELFIHLPTCKEVVNTLKKSGFTLIEDFFRSDKFEEPKAVKDFSGECQFWIVKNCVEGNETKNK